METVSNKTSVRQLISDQQWKEWYSAAEYPKSERAKTYTLHFLLIHNSEKSILQYLGKMNSENNAKLVAVDPKNHYHPLQIAALRCLTEVFKKIYRLILEDYPKKLNEKDFFGWQPSHYGALHSDTYQWLVAQKVDLTAKTKRGATVEDLKEAGLQRIRRDWSAKGQFRKPMENRTICSVDLNSFSPKEILKNIFSFLNFGEDLLSASSTCQLWRKVVLTNPDIWQRACSEELYAMKKYRGSWLERYQLVKVWDNGRFHLTNYANFSPNFRSHGGRMSKSGEFQEVIEKRDKPVFILLNRKTDAKTVLSSSAQDLCLFSSDRYFKLDRFTHQLSVYNLETLELERSLKLHLNTFDPRYVHSEDLTIIYADKNELIICFKDGPFHRLIGWDLETNVINIMYERRKENDKDQMTPVYMDRLKKWACLYTYSVDSSDGEIFVHNRKTSREQSLELPGLNFVALYLKEDFLYALNEKGNLYLWILDDDKTSMMPPVNIFNNLDASASMVVYRTQVIIAMGKELKIYDPPNMKCVQTVQLPHPVEKIYLSDEIPIVMMKKNVRKERDGDTPEYRITADYDYIVLDLPPFQEQVHAVD